MGVAANMWVIDVVKGQNILNVLVNFNLMGWYSMLVSSDSSFVKQLFLFIRERFICTCRKLFRVDIMTMVSRVLHQVMRSCQVMTDYTILMVISTFHVL